ncbi:MAG TPA: DUF2064 domain-containing protein, partial [Thiolapillus brandeum]|nr:DUF2064 domain-containing protein [Thiolapillus brandeum]
MSPEKILVFAKAPIPGQAKTRLIPALGEEGAARLHSKLVLHTLNSLHDIEYPVELWCTPDITHELFKTCAASFDIGLKRQQGKDLGVRMYEAFQATLTDTPWAILIGTDCPDLDSKDID